MRMAAGGGRGYLRTELAGGTKSELPGRSPAGPREYLSPKLPMLVGLVGPDTTAACSFFNVQELGTTGLERAFGAPGVPKSDTFQRLDRGGVPKSEPPTIFRSQLYLEESYVNA
jgi:hypothetical protein